MNFYETTYQASFSRPHTTFTYQRKPISINIPKHSTGFASNNRFSPFESTPEQTNQTHSRANISIHKTFDESKPIPRAVMERSGFWISPNINTNSRKKMQMESTYNKSFPKYPTNQDVYWKLNHNLIGSKDQTPFSRQHITISERPITAMGTTFQSSFREPKRQQIHIPSNVSIERSGFSDSIIPTHNKMCPLSQITENNLHKTEVQRLKCQDPVQYQNLKYHSPYMTISQISYQKPQSSYK